MDQIAVLVPCYNEAMTVGKVVRDFKEALPEAVIYVYDNNSTDGTDKIAREAGAVVRYEHMQGKGNVIRRMFREIDAECYIMIDGDDTYPASNAREMADQIFHNGADMVVGDRLSSTYFSENKRRFHNLGNVMVRTGINLLFKSDIKDIMTGYRAFSYNFVKTFPVLCKGFEIETEMTIHAIDKNMHIENVVVDYKDRPAGSESKLNTFKDGFKVIKTLLSLWVNYRPLHFFSWTAFVLCLITALIFIPCVWIPYCNTGLVDKMPTLIVCGFMFMSAILSFFIGLILNALSLKEKREFEFRMQTMTKFFRDRV